MRTASYFTSFYRCCIKPHPPNRVWLSIPHVREDGRTQGSLSVGLMAQKSLQGDGYRADLFIPHRTLVHSETIP